MKYNPTVKERRFLKAYIEGKSLAECARYAGSKGKDKDSLKVIGHRMLTDINPSMDEILELNGLTNHLIAAKTLEGLEADRVEVATFRGQIGDVQAFPDYSTRAKYLDILAKLKGRYIEKKELTGKDGGDITLIITPAGARSKGKRTLEIE